MFSPVGSQPPSVYWRRRLLVSATVVLLLVLLALTFKALTSDDETPAGASGTPSTQRSTAVGPNSDSGSKSKPTKTSKANQTSAASRTRTPSSSAAAPKRCRTSDLAVVAVVGKDKYRIGDKPTVELQVTNTGPKPCVQDLADRQVELKVYNGESRVWGSHDCETQDGTDDRVLAMGRPVRVSVTWSGLTSHPKCAGTRQRVGAGTYTLYAVLSGKTGKATQFSIS